MFFYRRPMWGIGIKIFLVIALITGGIYMATSAYQTRVMWGAVGEDGEIMTPYYHPGLTRSEALEAVEDGEMVAPYFHPHMKGYPMRGSFLPFLAIFFGGLLLIKLTTSIVGLVMFNRWKKEGGPDWDEMKARKYGMFRHHPYHFGPCHPGPWGAYPVKGEPGAETETPEDGEEKAS